MKVVPQINDNYLINKGVFYLLGIMIVVPFQFYLNSLDFWMYKFAPKNPPPRPPFGPSPPPPPDPSPHPSYHPLLRPPPGPHPNSGHSPDEPLSLSSGIPSPHPTYVAEFIITTPDTSFILPGVESYGLESDTLPSKIITSLNGYGKALSPGTYKNNFEQRQPTALLKSSSPYMYTYGNNHYDDDGKYDDDPSEPFNDDITPPDERTPIQTNFATAITVNFKVVLLVTLVYCYMRSSKLPPPEKRLKWCLIALCILFLMATTMTQIKSKGYVLFFFGGTILSATIMNCFIGVASASLYELTSKFPSIYYAYLLSGNNICGILSAVIQIIVLTFRLPKDTSGTIYFSFGTITLILTTVYYCIAFNNSKYFIYRIDQSEHVKGTNAPSKMKLTHVLLKIKWFYITMIFVEGTTHIVYPGLAAIISPLIRDTKWKDVYFVPVITFLGFQVCTWFGRETARIIKKPKNGIILFVIATLRMAFVPLLIFCNAQPRRNLPVYFGDKTYICALFTFGFSEGLLMNISIVAIPSMLKKEERKAAMTLLPLVSAVTITLSSALNVFITNVI